MHSGVAKSTPIVMPVTQVISQIPGESYADFKARLKDLPIWFLSKMILVKYTFVLYLG
jgi:hypothetical protein